jgi:hypothetical protein
MSVWAYRDVDNVTVPPSFNVWHDHDLMDFLDAEAEFSTYLTHGGVGCVIVEVKVLRKALKNTAKLNLSDKIIRRIKNDITYAESEKEDTVTYHCF